MEKKQVSHTLNIEGDIGPKEQKEGKQMSVVEYIDELLVEEEELEHELFDEAAALASLSGDELPKDWNLVARELGLKFPQADAHSIGFAVKDAREALER